jgi:tRNA synthetases class I (R)
MEGRPENILDVVLRLFQRHGLAGTRVSVPHHPSRRELSLIGLPQRSEATEAALAELQQLTAIDRVSVGKVDRVGVRLSDRYVAEVGELLESGAAEVLHTADLRAGLRVAVDFCDLNATQALHVGHLRNVALGQAMAAILKACGARVATSSQVGDTGRNMAEAVAGYVKFTSAADPLSRGEKSDHFVGACHSRYVQQAGEHGMPEGVIGDPTAFREDLDWDDLATEILARLNQTDPETLALSRTLRDWALEGQAETLARLNIAIDNHFLESEFLAEIESCGDRLLEMEAIEVGASGVTFHATGNSDYPHLVLRGSDGSSTKPLRYLALWDATRGMVTPGESLQVKGDEWLPLARYGDLLLQRLAGEEPAHPRTHLLHGMVTVDDQVVKSGTTTPWLIDELLDELAAQPELMAAASGDTELAERLATITALGFFCGQPPAKSVALSPDVLLDSSVSAGWAIALAALKAWDERYDGPPDPAPNDRDYRFLVAQSQVHRQLSRRVCNELNPAHLARLHMHLSQWFVGTECTPSLARAMRTVSSAGLASLGLPALGRVGWGALPGAVAT